MALDDLLLDPDAVAAKLGAEVSTLRTWRRRRQGPPYVQIAPNTIRYPAGELAQWLASRTVRP